ncbi:hypothetical protein PENTCL1PPCAC_28422, partial [Pristionchus entomophagus]
MEPLELLNCFFNTFSNQLTTFRFASPFYKYLIENGTAWVTALMWYSFSMLSLHTRFYIAITRLSAIRPNLFTK